MRTIKGRDIERQRLCGCLCRCIHRTRRARIMQVKRNMI